MLVSGVETVTRARLAVIGVDDQLADVATLLSDTQIGLVVVCDAGGAMVGVITETHVVRRLGHGQTSVFTTSAGDVMKRDVISCRPADSLAEVLATMHHHGLIHVPVVDEDNRPVGVLTARDGLRALLAEGNFEESLLRNYVMGIGYQ